MEPGEWDVSSALPVRARAAATERPNPSPPNGEGRKMAMSDHEVYDNPLVHRYASREMARLWGPQRKFSTWRRLWVALAEAQCELGLLADDGVSPRIKESQLAELRAHVDEVDFARAAEYERRLRHDVMAHIRTYAEACPSAGDIIHLGATSCYVTDKRIHPDARIESAANRLVGTIGALARCRTRRGLPTLGFTHSVRPAHHRWQAGQPLVL